MIAPPFIHPTAIVEAGVEVGEGTAIWDSVHMRSPSRIGSQCIVGEKTYVAYGVEIGNRVKINAHVYICTGVRIEDGVMISAGVIFTNDRYPRATDPDLVGLRPSEPDGETLSTTVRAGATIGAGALIGPGIEIGPYAMVGMGAVVTSSVAAFDLVAGNPARSRGRVCRCGHPFVRSGDGEVPDGTFLCVQCGRGFRVQAGLADET